MNKAETVGLLALEPLGEFEWEAEVEITPPRRSFRLQCDRMVLAALLPVLLGMMLVVGLVAANKDSWAYGENMALTEQLVSDLTEQYPEADSWNTTTVAMGLFHFCVQPSAHPQADWVCFDGPRYFEDGWYKLSFWYFAIMAIGTCLLFVSVPLGYSATRLLEVYGHSGLKACALIGFVITAGVALAGFVLLVVDAPLHVLLGGGILVNDCSNLTLLHWSPLSIIGITTLILLIATFAVPVYFVHRVRARAALHRAAVGAWNMQQRTYKKVDLL